jgi:hypothetical protein
MPASLLRQAWMASHWGKKVTIQQDFFLLECDGKFCHNTVEKIKNTLI